LNYCRNITDFKPISKLKNLEILEVKCTSFWFFI
jgi:hypothetical protein